MLNHSTVSKAVFVDIYQLESTACGMDVRGMLLQLAPEVSITLPPEVFHRDIASDRLKFIYFRSSKLFVGSRHTASSADDVITASVGPEVAFDLPNCVMFVIPNRQASPFFFKSCRLLTDHFKL